MSAPRLPLASDEWMAEQQLRAELEAEAWRRMRAERLLPPPPVAIPAPPPEIRDPSLGGSLVLKALVRFALGAAMAYLAFIAALDSQLGAFEAWLAAGAAFLVTLSLSMFSPFRRLIHAIAETARWAIIVGLALAALWYALNQGGMI